MRCVSTSGEDHAQDDDGNLLRDEAGTFVPLEAAHIIPHLLLTVPAGMSELVGLLCPKSYQEPLVYTMEVFEVNVHLRLI